MMGLVGPRYLHSLLLQHHYYSHFLYLQLPAQVSIPQALCVLMDTTQPAQQYLFPQGRSSHRLQIVLLSSGHW